MKSVVKSTILCAMVSVAAANYSFAQTQAKDEKEVAYKKVVTERADKIVTILGLTEVDKVTRVRDIIAVQYVELNKIHDARNAAVKNIKEVNKDDKAKADAEVKKLEDDANKKLDKLHAKYIKSLSKELTAEQVDMVKDGMTYKVLPITYTGYQQMLPNLTEAQKKQILVYLTEAREHAMDAESSEKKHAWFGKYKGKINNYLSSAGIDMKKAGKEWEERIKAANAKKE